MQHEHQHKQNTLRASQVSVNNDTFTEKPSLK